MGRARLFALAATALTLFVGCAAEQPDALSRDHSCEMLAAHLHQYEQTDNETADRSTLIRQLDVLAYETYDQDLAAATRRYADLVLRYSQGEDLRDDFHSATERLHELCPTQISRPSPVARRRAAPETRIEVLG